MVEMRLGQPTRIDHVVTMEDISQGQRVAEYVIEGLRGDGWTRVAAGSTIGYKKIDRFDPVKVSGVRLRVTKSLAAPLIRKLAVFDTTAP